MTGWRAKRRTAAALLLAAVAIGPALGQSAPESLLPPGFGDPAPEPEAPADRPTDLLPPSATGTDSPAADPLAPAADDPAADGAEDADEAEAEEEPAPDPLDLPDTSRRDPRFAGVIDSDGGGVGEEAWGRADGRYLSTLMRRLNAPVASRWGSILLRRALLTRAAAPRGVGGADWAAERAWLLIRMGEATSARALVQSVDVDRYTPKLHDVAMQAMLATADPVGVCPLTTVSAKTYLGWDLARAWCASLAGDNGTAGAIVDAARRRHGRGIDMLLAEKLVNAGTGGRRATTIQWDGVSALSSWRYGLATATGVSIPAELLAAANPRVSGWAATAPMRPLADRQAAAEVAARIGVLSNLAYVDLLSAIADGMDPAEVDGTAAGNLRTAYAATEDAAKLAALRAIWDGEGDALAGQVLTARAAARIRPDAALSADAPRLIAAMLSAGLDLQADRWSAVANQAGGDAWALLAAGSPQPRVDLSAARTEAFVSEASATKARFLVAALAGLGRLDAAAARRIDQEAGLGLTRQSRWSEAIDAAAAAQQPGTVVLLAATGLQAGDWRGVPTFHLFHIVRALSAVGLEAEARMIAAEAIART
ncbi:hypothetical protein GGR88_001041 [Sphingomonas jejuensis]|uniref:Uncharacterized protein n=1 Tax=Sphingomonas jejuensis TaxID=904715 RepID=A0ABX0XJP3_9SPHN|nr:hypothetical protein [Sphingomonas jejuensis]NJC33567.1 hypothetical protein [Sphingomonas jejuensis]